MTFNDPLRLLPLLSEAGYPEITECLVDASFPYRKPERQSMYAGILANSGRTAVIDRACGEEFGGFPFLPNIHTMVAVRDSNACLMRCKEGKCATRQPSPYEAQLCAEAFIQEFCEFGSKNRGNAAHFINVPVLAAHFAAYSGENKVLRELCAAVGEQRRVLLLAAALFHDIGKTENGVNHAYIGADMLEEAWAQRDAVLERFLTANGILAAGEPGPGGDARPDDIRLLLTLMGYHERWGMALTGETNLEAGIAEPLRAAQEYGENRLEVFSLLSLLHMADIASSIPLREGCVYNKFELSPMLQLLPGSADSCARIDFFLNSTKGLELQALLQNLRSVLETPDLGALGECSLPMDFHNRVYRLIRDSALKAQDKEIGGKNNEVLRFFTEDSHREEALNVIGRFRSDDLAEMLDKHGQLVYCLGWVNRVFENSYIAAAGDGAQNALNKDLDFTVKNVIEQLCATFFLKLCSVRNEIRRGGETVDKYGNILFSASKIQQYV